MLNLAATAYGVGEACEVDALLGVERAGVLDGTTNSIGYLGKDRLAPLWLYGIDDGLDQLSYHIAIRKFSVLG